MDDRVHIAELNSNDSATSLEKVHTVTMETIGHSSSLGLVLEMMCLLNFCDASYTT